MPDRGWRTAVCVASGPSLTDEQCTIAAEAQADGRCHIIAVNDNWSRVPSADVLYACDRHWWNLHIAVVRVGFEGELWTQHAETAQKYSLNRIEAKRGDQLLPKGDPRITQGRNSGFQALLLARHFGATRIILIGYDMQRTGGKLHWFGPHPAGLSNGDPRSFVRHFEAIAGPLRAEGTHVINSTIASALGCFLRQGLREALTT